MSKALPWSEQQLPFVITCENTISRAIFMLPSGLGHDYQLNRSLNAWDTVCTSALSIYSVTPVPVNTSGLWQCLYKSNSQCNSVNTQFSRPMCIKFTLSGNYISGIRAVKTLNSTFWQKSKSMHCIHVKCNSHFILHLKHQRCRWKDP